MDYKIIHLEEKTMVGLSARTNNKDPLMGKTIGGLWKQLFAEKIFFTIANQANDRSIGLYTNYSSDVSGEYDIVVGREVTEVADLPKGTVVKTIPAGNYAEFLVPGNDMDAIGAEWEKIWELPLERTYTGDFEEYRAAKECGMGEIHIFIAVK